MRSISPHVIRMLLPKALPLSFSTKIRLKKRFHLRIALSLALEMSFRLMDDSILVWNTRDPLNGRTPEQFEAEVKRILEGKVEAAYVFGSYSTPEFGRDSDIDMIVVARTETGFVERPLDYPEIFDLVPDLDLLVYTPEEFSNLTTNPSPGFWTSATASLRRIL